MLESVTPTQPPTSVPPPLLERVTNGTSFRHLAFDKMGPRHVFSDVIVISASFELAPGRLAASASHRGPIMADEHVAAPETSSLAAAGDVVRFKPASDVYLTGTARSGTPRTSWLTLLRLRGDARLHVDKSLRVTGPRRWFDDGTGTLRLSPPVPTTAVPLCYELAYGGTCPDAVGAPGANPSGTGASPVASPGDVAGPQIEYPDEPILRAGRGRVAGFGPLARFWSPRAGRAGTYDDAWLAQYRALAVPDFPRDFDERFYQVAPDDQVVAPHLTGNETLELAGFFGDRSAMVSRLPGVRVAAYCSGNGGTRVESARLDTVHVDLDAERVHLTWRLVLDRALGIRHARLEAQDTEV